MTIAYCYTTNALTLPESSLSQGVYFYRLTFTEYIPSGTAGTIKFYTPSESNAAIIADTATAVYTHIGALTDGSSTYSDLSAEASVKALPGMKFKVTLTHTSGALMPYFGDLTLTYRVSPWLVTTEYPDKMIQNETILVSIRFSGKDEMSSWGVGSATNNQIMPCRITVTILYPMDMALSNTLNPEVNAVEGIMNIKINALLQYLNCNTYDEYGYKHWRKTDDTQLTPIYAYSAWSKTLLFSSTYEADNV